MYKILCPVKEILIFDNKTLNDDKIGNKRDRARFHLKVSQKVSPVSQQRKTQNIQKEMFKK